jgi:hypothetical protein
MKHLHLVVAPMLLCGLACTTGEQLGDVPGILRVTTCDRRGDPAGGISASTTQRDGKVVTGTSGDNGTVDLNVVEDTYTVLVRGGAPDRQITNVAVAGGGIQEVLDEACVGPRQLPGRGAVAGDMCNRHVAAWVGGARVVVWASTGERRETRTDAQGHFLMENVPEGPARIRITGVGPFVREVQLNVEGRRVNWITTRETCDPLGPGECADADDDGYGASAECIWTDCNDADPDIFEGCLDPLPGQEDSVDAPPVRLLPRIEVSPEELNFTGLLPNRPPRTATVTIRNLGTGVLELGAPRFDPGGDRDMFLLNGVVHNLLPMEEVTLSVVALSGAVPRTYQAKILIPSNDDLRPLVTVILKSVVGALPGFVMSPTSCDRAVGVGRPAICEFSLSNTADTDLQITVATMTQSSDQIFSVENLLLPRNVGRGTAVTVRVIATPPLAQIYEGDLQIVSNEGQNLLAHVRVAGTANPTAVVDVQSVGGVMVPSGTTPNIRPLDDVVMTAARSSAPPGRTLVARQWRLVSRPSESTVVLLTPAGPTTAFAFNSSGVTRRGVDVAGTYVVGLQVTDSQGVRSAEATLTLQAVPSAGITVQLTWDHPSADIDLHLVRGNGPVNSPNDCYYANCKPGAANFPDWDGVTGRSPGDPVLDVDDTNGYGPETTSVEDAPSGIYEVGVHSFGQPSGDTVPCTVKIYVNASLVAEYRRTLVASKDYWRVGTVTIPSGAVGEIDTVERLP